MTDPANQLPPLDPALLRRLSLNDAVLKQPLVFRFKPAEDITAFELATLFPFLMGRPLLEDMLDKLGTAKRHLEPVQPPKPEPEIVT